MPILSLQDVYFKFDTTQTHTLKNINLDIDKGEIVSVIGENGAGKSTFLKCIAGKLEFYPGEIFYNGKNIKRPSEQLISGHPDIKILRQGSTLPPNKNIIEILRFEMKAFPIQYIKDRTDYLLSLCDLHELKLRKSNELSGGQRQRAAIAVLLSTEPELVLMDEPFSDSDIFIKTRLKKQILEILRKVNCTCIFTTHSSEEALSLSDRIVVLKDGQIAQTGTPEEIYSNPVSPYVAELSGHVNILFEKSLNKNVNTDKLIGLRFEDLILSESKLKNFITGTVTDIIYLGSHFEIEVLCNKDVTIHFYTNKRLMVGEEATIQYDATKVIKFLNK